jgi:GNAT superfamily N-acetyltransferase
MPPVFTFNSRTTSAFPVEQRQNCLAAFSMSYEAYYDLLHQSFTKVYRQARKNAVREVTMFVVENLAEDLRKFPVILATADRYDPSTWGYAFRYRADVPWYVVCLSGEYNEQLFNSYPIVRLLHTKDLINWGGLDTFITQGMWAVQQGKGPLSSWEPLNNFLYNLSSLVRPNLLTGLHEALSTVNFFQTQDDLGLEDLPFMMERGKSPAAWGEVWQMCQSFFPLYCESDLHDFWAKVRLDSRTQLWIARSRHQSEDLHVKPTMLGFLIGGLHPLTEDPHISAICVLPDERRQGIATSLVRRFFAQTGYHFAGVGTYMGPHYWQYEAAGFLKSLGAELQSKGKFIWSWQVPSPMRVHCG